MWELDDEVNIWTTENTSGGWRKLHDDKLNNLYVSSLRSSNQRQLNGNIMWTP
jgi:hypothetical protein